MHETISIRRPRFSLRLKLTLGLILIIGIVFVSSNTYNLITQYQRTRAEALKTRTTVARLVYSALAEQVAGRELDDPRIKTSLKNFLTTAIILDKGNRDVAFGLVVDKDGKLIAGRAKPKLIQFPGNKRLSSEVDALTRIAQLHAKLGPSMKTSRIKVKQHNEEVGVLMVGISLDRIDAEFWNALYRNIGISAGALLLLVIYSVLALGTMVVRPINRVMLAMRKVHQGDLDHTLNLRSNDEIGVLADTYNYMVGGLREREQLKDAFSRYVSSQVYEKLKHGSLTLTGEMRNATVLFSDIRSFTALSERLSPADIVRMLNEYFNVMVDVVFKHEGFLNKFIGDALMAVYNVPLDQDEPELRAVRTALEMIEALDQFNKKRAERGLFAVKIGIGINTGPVVAGNIGHMQRLEYTVIGDAVNLAQRIESQTKVTGMPILVSDTTYRAVAGKVVAQALPPVKVKGKQEPVELFAVTGLSGQQSAGAADAPIPVPPTA